MQRLEVVTTEETVQCVFLGEFSKFQENPSTQPTAVTHPVIWPHAGTCHVVTGCPPGEVRISMPICMGNPESVAMPPATSPVISQAA
eukprot:COSAG02_NODE_2812_length_7975_cov_110.220543_7_plen_87_part_00